MCLTFIISCLSIKITNREIPRRHEDETDTPVHFNDDLLRVLYKQRKSSAAMAVASNGQHHPDQR